MTENNWSERHKFQIQSASLAAIVLGSLALYVALQAGLGFAAAICFGVIALAMLVTMGIS